MDPTKKLVIIDSDSTRWERRGGGAGFQSEHEPFHECIYKDNRRYDPTKRKWNSLRPVLVKWKEIMFFRIYLHEKSCDDESCSLEMFSQKDFGK